MWVDEISSFRAGIFVRSILKPFTRESRGRLLMHLRYFDAGLLAARCIPLATEMTTLARASTWLPGYRSYLEQHSHLICADLRSMIRTWPIQTFLRKQCS